MYSIDCHGLNIRHAHSQLEGGLRDQTFKGKASVGWFQKFKRRHREIALRNPPLVGMGRVSMSSESVMENHFEKLTNASGMWTKLSLDRSDSIIICT